MFEEENRSLAALREAIGEWGVPVREIFANDRLRGGQRCLIEVLHPPRRGVLGNDNANSLVLAIEYGGRRILLPGDLEPPGLDAVLAEEPWDCDVLLAPHHGSGRSNPPGLARWSAPEWVVVSGSLNDYEPDTEATYRAAGGEVLHTGRVGAVRVVIEKGGLEVSSYLESR
jgi:competence protein ComEC